jgi:hypothetical protein
LQIHGHCTSTLGLEAKLQAAGGSVIREKPLQAALRGKISHYDPFRIQALESLGLGVEVPWEDRLSELADYRNIHGTATFRS